MLLYALSIESFTSFNDSTKGLSAERTSRISSSVVSMGYSENIG
jgi:hypothetical protein